MPGPSRRTIAPKPRIIGRPWRKGCGPIGKEVQRRAFQSKGGTNSNCFFHVTVAFMTIDQNQCVDPGV